MATTAQQGLQADGQRSGRQVLAFAFAWLAVPLLVLAGWLVVRRIDRLLHWSKADAEVRRVRYIWGVLELRAAGLGALM